MNNPRVKITKSEKKMILVEGRQVGIYLTYNLREREKYLESISVLGYPKGLVEASPKVRTLEQMRFERERDFLGLPEYTRITDKEERLRVCMELAKQYGMDYNVYFDQQFLVMPQVLNKDFLTQKPKPPLDPSVN